MAQEVLLKALSGAVQLRPDPFPLLRVLSGLGRYFSEPW